MWPRNHQAGSIDPLSRRQFWELIERIRADRPGMSVLVATAYMEEAGRFDWLVAMNDGRALATGSPHELLAHTGTRTLEEAFIALPPATQRESYRPVVIRPREAGEETEVAIEARDLTMRFGDFTAVDRVSFRDQTNLSRDYALNLAGSRYFIERPPIRDHADLDQRMRAGEISLTIEIPPGFARDIARDTPVQVGAWIDGAMPQRAETVRGYVQGTHYHWLEVKAREAYGAAATAGQLRIETRFRYNPDVKSLPAMVPAAIPLMLLMIPAILSALSVVREKELGSIVNFYVTPATPLELLVGKQIPCVVLAMASFLLLTAQAIFLFGVPLKGSFPALAAAALLYVVAATALGLVISAFMRSHVAALFGTALLTLLPAVQYSGLIDPVSSLQGAGRFIGEIYPTTHFLTIARGTFSKGLDFQDLRASFVPLLIAVPVLIGIGAALLRKQEQ